MYRKNRGCLGCLQFYPMRGWATGVKLLWPVMLHMDKNEKKALFYKLNLNPSHKMLKTPQTNHSFRTCPQVNNCSSSPLGNIKPGIITLVARLFFKRQKKYSICLFFQRIYVIQGDFLNISFFIPPKSIQNCQAPRYKS